MSKHQTCKDYKMKSHCDTLSGVFSPVVTLFEGGLLDLLSLRKNLKIVAKSGLKGYLALGSNGEFMSLSEQEQLQVLEVFAEEKADKVIMVGTARESSKHTIDFSNRVAQMGFEYVSVLTPHYFAKQMNGPTLERYYTRIADEVKVPVLLYNAPGFAGGVHIPPATVAKLAEHPNIAGMKDSSPTGPAKFLNVCGSGDDFAILAGSANFLYPSLHLGAPGGIVSVANFLPDPCCEMYSSFMAADYDKARDLHFRLARLNAAVSGAYGVAGVKAAMALTGFSGGEPRHPLIPVDDDGRALIAAAIEREGFKQV